MESAEVILDLTLSNATVFLSALLVVLFLVRGLQRVYPVFFAYWVFDLCLSSLPLLIADFPTQMRATLIGIVVRWFLYFLLVIELIDRILEDHPGVAKIGRRLVQAVMVLAIAGSVYTLQFDSAQQSTLDSRLQLVFQLERVISGCLLALLLAISIFLWIFPIRLNRNTKAYCFGFSVFFLANTIGPFLINTRGAAQIERSDAIHLGGELFCQILWLFSITRRGAESTGAFPRHWTPDEQQRALATLGALEQRISRARSR